MVFYEDVSTIIFFKEDFTMTDFLTPGEMAKVLRTPLSWIYSQTRKKGKNTIPVTRIGKYMRFEEDKVLEWIRGQKGGATAER